MADLKKISLRLLLLALLLAGMNLIYRQFFFPEDLAEQSPVLVDLENAADTARVIYFGESSNFTFEDTDADKRSISQFAAEYFPSLPFAAVQQGALHGGNYLSLLRNVPPDSPLETVVVTLNLRSFDAGWINSKLETSLQKSMTLARPGPPLWRRFLLGFRGYEIKTEAEREADRKAQWAKEDLGAGCPWRTVIDWDSAIVKKGIPGPDGSYNEFLTGLATQYVKTYAFRIDTLTNPRIRDFDRIAELCQRRGWNLVLLLLPENVERAAELVPELPAFMRAGRDLLVERYEKRGARVVELLELLPNAEFTDQDWTTEHYGEAGRKAVAEKLAETLREIYPQAYRKVRYARVRQRVFVNDCEGGEIWGQMNSLSDERAHSGSKSARIGMDNAFSVTFTRAIPDLDSAYLDSVAVSFWLFQEALAPLASIAIEAGGDETGNMWDTTALRRYTQVTGTWTRVEVRLPLRPELPKAEVVKVYLYNPSPFLVWADDLRIEFLRKLP
jgi:hypothetical protein